MSTIAKNAALAMITGLDQSQNLLLRQHCVSDIPEAIQVCLRNQGCALIESDQFFQCPHAIPDYDREDFLGYREDLASLCAWKVVVEDSYFFPSRNVPLQNEIGWHTGKVVFQI